MKHLSMRHISKGVTYLLALVLAISMVGGIAPAAFAQDTPDKPAIVILHTNDVHCSGLETSKSSIGYAGIAAAANQAQKEYGEGNVTMVDAGDAIQGQPIGTLSKGGDLVDIMNEAGYDVAALGNHEFDYGMDRLSELEEQADYTYVCSNMLNLETDKSVFKPYEIFEYKVNEKTVKVAYIGITTPTTLTSTNPKVFENAAGELKYSFYGDATGEALYKRVQEVVDEARSDTGDNVDYVIALSHLGASATSSLPERWTSTEVIRHTTGIDAVIDGHTHLVYNEQVENAAGEKIWLAQAGTAFQAYGTLTITPDKDPSPDDITSTITQAAENIPQDESVAKFVERKEAKLKETLDKPVGTLGVFFQVFSPNADGQPWYWTARMRETNLGDFVADAYRITLDADIGFVNGGGIGWYWDEDTTSFGIEPGEFTYGNAIEVNNHANSLSLVELSGQTILDALEFSVRRLTPALDDETEASGGFLQVSGLSFRTRLDIPSPVITDDDDNFVGIDGQRRVSNVMVGGKPLDPNATYKVATITFLLDGGSGYTMLRNSNYLGREISLDYEALINYVKQNLGGTIGDEYANPSGSGRIVFTTDPSSSTSHKPESLPGEELGDVDDVDGLFPDTSAPGATLPPTGDPMEQSAKGLLVLVGAAVACVLAACWHLKPRISKDQR